MTLEAMRRSVESIAHRNINILVGMVLGGVARYHDLAFRYHEVHRHVIQFALAMVPTVRLDDDMAAGDLGVKVLQRRGAVLNPRFDR